MRKIYGRCEIINWPDFNNEIHALPEQIIKQDAAMTYNGSLFIDKKLGTGRFGKKEQLLQLIDNMPDYKIGYILAFVKGPLACDDTKK